MSASSAHPGIGARHHRTPIETTALAADAVFAHVGILGVHPRYGTCEPCGPFGPGSSY